MHSTIRTGVYNVLPEQTLYVVVADVADNSDASSSVSIKFLDGNGDVLDSVEGSLVTGHSIGLQIKGEEIPNASPQNRLRVVIDRRFKVGIDSYPITTIELHNDLGLTIGERFSCSGPGVSEGNEDEPELNCPGVWQANTIILP